MACWSGHHARAGMRRCAETPSNAQRPHDRVVGVLILSRRGSAPVRHPSAAAALGTPEPRLGPPPLKLRWTRRSLGEGGSLAGTPAPHSAPSQARRARLSRLCVSKRVQNSRFEPHNRLRIAFFFVPSVPSCPQCPLWLFLPRGKNLGLGSSYAAISSPSSAP